MAPYYVTAPNVTVTLYYSDGANTSWATSWAGTTQYVVRLPEPEPALPVRDRHQVRREYWGRFLSRSNVPRKIGSPHPGWPVSGRHRERARWVRRRD